MRLDKFLKMSRVIKSRTVANEVADNGRVSVNGKIVKPSYEVKIGDIVEVKVYADDGASGSNFDRTEFRRMLADIELGVINMVILKDVSRLGREHIDTNYSLGKYFPEKRIRVVSLLDHYDSSVAAYIEYDA